MPKIPNVSRRQAQRAFETLGYWVVRQGPHLVMTNGTRIVTLPRHNPINAYTLGAIVVGAGLTVEEFKKLLR